MPNRKFTLIKLRNFKGGLHLSKGDKNSYSEGQKVLHSDTLKSALFVCCLQLYGEKIANKEFLEGFKISSAFPFVDNGVQNFFYFPKPNTRLNLKIVNQENIEHKGSLKILKKLKFLEKNLFEKVINQEEIKLQNKVNIKGDYASLSESASQLKLFKNETYQHVTIDRLGKSDSDTYYVDKRYFHQNAGLFFLLECNDTELKSKVISSLRLLADSGIGTDRNNGNGLFEFGGKEGIDVIEDFELKVPDVTSSHNICLSLYLPKDENELGNLDKAQYDLIKRGGYIASPSDTKHLTLRKRSVYMFEEGSLFYGTNQRTGNIVDLQPSIEGLQRASIDKLLHPIYRDGRAIFIPCKI